MNFSDYIGIGPEEFTAKYLDTGLVQVSHHHEFPLSIYTYGRKAVHENVWDNVTSRCRGIIVNRETGEIVARPFEKFHDYRSEPVQHLPSPHANTQPVVWEKMDGFLVTGYQWNGIWYAASKGSFHSIHAKWATSEIRRYGLQYIPKGYTPVCEGLHPDLRIVVDYGKRKELVLLALVNIETGEESIPNLIEFGVLGMGFNIPRSFDMTWQDAHAMTTQTRDESQGDKGFVLTWYRLGTVPFRLTLRS